MMKSLANKLAFLFKVALRNILHNRFRSIIILITFVVISILSLLTFATKPFLNHFIYQENYAKYTDIDLILATDDRSKTRFFSTRDLQNNLDLENDFQFVAPFFEFTTMIETSSDYTYVNLYASSLTHFAKILAIKPNTQILKEKEIIITKTLSDKYNININDHLTLLIGKSKLNFKVIEIIPDNNLFSDLTVFIDKTTNAELFLNSLGLGNLPNIVFQNIYNRVYFSLNDNSNKTEIINRISSLYPNQVIKETVSQEYIAETVTKYGSLIFLIMTFILIVVLLVLQSTFTLIFEDRKNQIAVVDILGGVKSFTFLTLLIEFLIYFLPSFFISILLTNTVINVGLKYIGANFTYKLSLTNIIAGLGLSLGCLLNFEVYNLLKIRNTSLIKLSKTSYVHSSHTQFFSIGLLGISVIMYVVNLIFLKNVVSIKVYYLISTIIAFIIGIILPPSLIFLIAKITKRLKHESIFTLTSLNNLFFNKITHHIITLMTMSFLIIILLTGLNEYIADTTKKVRNTITIDYALTNITLNYDRTYQEIKKYENIQQVNKSYIFTDTYIHELDAIFNYHVSLDFDDLTYYFNIDLDNKTIEKLTSSDNNYVILPIKYHYLNNLNTDDKVTLEISKDFPNQEYIIAGFYHSPITEIIFTNFYYLQSKHDSLPNAIILTTINKDQVKKHLIETYAKEMYYIIAFQDLIEEDIKLMVSLNGYFTYLILILIGCFLITIINNALLEFTNLKNILARLRVLGISLKKLLFTLFTEKLLQYTLTLISLLVILNVLKRSLSYLLLFYSTYLDFTFSIKSIIFGTLLSFIMYCLSYLYYFYKVKKMNYVHIVKTMM